VVVAPVAQGLLAPEALVAAGLAAQQAGQLERLILAVVVVAQRPGPVASVVLALLSYPI
jgi:hypothetical protein